MENFDYEPLKLYDTKFKQDFNANCKEYFENELEKSKIDKEANQKTCSEYYKLESSYDRVNKGIKKFKPLKILTIIFYVIAFILLIYCISVLENLKALFIALIVLFTALMIYLVFFLFNKKIKKQKSISNTLSEQMGELKGVAFSQVEPLLKQLNYDIPKILIEKTVPEIDLDDYFTLDKYFHLVSNYNFSPSFPENESALSVVSGNVKGFPFAVLTSLSKNMINKVYTGALTIHWTTTERDSNGKFRTVHHTQVLHATSVHPAPSYNKLTRLYYGNDSAPNLSFSRNPCEINGLSDKEIEKKINKLSKKAEKKSQKSLGESNFTSMGNDEFEALFGATDRDNEVEFRLLFTPLAQKNEVATIRDRKYFGDDFSFYKNKKLNTIVSKHSQGFDFTGNPKNYYSFDYKEIENKFFNYNEEYFLNIYFDFVPLLNIPLYQQTDSINKMAKVNYSKCGRNFNPYEAECLANSMEDEFAPKIAKTRSILKTKILSSEKDEDIFEVTAFAFDSVERVDYVPVLGGDGRMHPVPVIWEEFIPIANKQSFMVTRKEMQNSNVSQRGFFAKIIN